MPDKKCSCGSTYHKDGFGIDAYNMYPFCKWTEIYVSYNGTDLVKNCLHEYFKGYGELREIKINRDGIETISSDKIRVTKFGLLSKEMTKKFPEEIIILRPEEYSQLLDEVSVLTVIENMEEQLCSQDLLNMEFTAKQIKEYFEYAVENGKFNGYDGDMNIGKVISNIKTPSFNDLLIISGFSHSTGAWRGNADLLYDKGISLGKLISCREDVYTYLYDKLSGKCCDNPSGLVVEIKEAVCKGKYSNNRMPLEIESLLLECEVPEWYVESMKKILYLFPKTHLIVLLKRDICKFIVMNNSL
ncbi:MAG: hypothetical protein EOM40_17040 [Clostridia bacterium]|nr:hypothetical protein [Clostridia bacterium]NCC42691.1 hypothetical protein [Clostridia bacterium]